MLAMGWHCNGSGLLKIMPIRLAHVFTWMDECHFPLLVSMYGFQFGLSAAMKKAERETAGNKRVYLDQKKICNYGTVEYLTDARGIHKVSKLFYDRVMSLPIKYSVHDYMNFIDSFGTVSETLIIVTAQ